MMSVTAFDKQLTDLVWSMSTALRAGYSLDQIFEQLAAEAPEPTASSCGRVGDDLKRGLSINQALTNLRQTTSSHYLGDVVAVIEKQRKTGGNLAFMLAPVGEEILAKVGSDGAFFPTMRSLAQRVGATLPPRVKDA